jgi:hypothetical protein
MKPPTPARRAVAARPRGRPRCARARAISRLIRRVWRVRRWWCAGCSTWPLDVMMEPGGRATLLGGAGIGCIGMLANMAPPWGCDWLSRTMDIFCGVMAAAGLGFIYMCVSLRHVLLNFHLESVSGWTGFRLGFVYHFPRAVWFGLYLFTFGLYLFTFGLYLFTFGSVLLDFCKWLGKWRHTAFRGMYSKFKFSVQHTIKNPQPKARPTRDTFAMNFLCVCRQCI